MSGLDLTQTIKKQFENMPVVLMSGWPDASNNLAYLAGADDFLAKPIDFARLRQCLRQYC